MYLCHLTVQGVNCLPFIQSSSYQVQNKSTRQYITQIPAFLYGSTYHVYFKGTRYCSSYPTTYLSSAFAASIVFSIIIVYITPFSFLLFSSYAALNSVSRTSSRSISCAHGSRKYQATSIYVDPCALTWLLFF